MKVSLRLRSTLVVVFDLVAVVVAWFGAYFLRFNFEWAPVLAAHEKADEALLVLLAVQLITCRFAGLYLGMWSFASLPDLRRVMKAVVISALAIILLTVFAWPAVSIPRSILVLYPILLLGVMAGGRILWRMSREGLLHPNSQRVKGTPVVVVGAGTAGMMLVRELARTDDWHVVALIDDDPKKLGLELQGCRVEGRVSDLPEVMRKHQVKHVILAMPSASPETLQRITSEATRTGSHLFTVPGLGELMSGRVAINVMRPVKIEDLLGRKSVQIDTDNVQAMLSGKRLLVTGAGGSIGSELCRQLSRFSPATIVLVESSEFALYMIDSWFKEHRPEINVIPLTGDVKDEVRMRQIFDQWTPQVVFHAAAYKHVPLMEVGNAWEAVRNNVLGTHRVATEAIRVGAERFVLISTDKAVNPTNVMGTTKRLAEMVCETLQRQSPVTKLQTVRFGNVLGSTGSVIPRFQSQIAKGGPITVTHPDITRYFMSIPEAAQLVLQAAAMGNGGEVFVLDMGSPVKIVDLAQNMIRLAGYNEDEIKVVYTGLRPGEKLFEELLADAEETVATQHAKLRIVKARCTADDFMQQIADWQLRVEPLSDDEVRRVLKHWVPEYTPQYQ
ncbi:polysaccharide biosynthesis protein [Paenalcaligenes niemegkensis]|uniref:polysaccharide biosynthesis protein n=1 Tax=Paenalcaligenes niemegkensis TaxID=2895469 RepID=UPI001EE8CC31|nr:nucleoside-diphosphate sugar epimerase/dehydratase [Paenalcaligenes niemegkensis]MCQ9618265.1 polysaccharide biosynthesis protein [Paenalcaligenes niemegkensis]